MSSIRKTIVGYIDMSKVIAVRGPFLDPAGVNGAWFEIDVQLRDAPIKFFRDTDFGTEAGWFENRYQFLTTVPNHPYVRGGPVLDTVIGQNVKKQIDEFVAEWNTWKDR